MNMKRTVIILLLITCSTALALSQRTVTAQAEAINLLGRVVVFFAPQEDQYDPTIVDSVALSDTLFGKYRCSANALESLLVQNKIGFFTTSANSIRVRWSGHRFVFDPAGEDSSFGMIMSDGLKEPKVVPGFKSDVELQKEIRSFFQFK